MIFLTIYLLLGLGTLVTSMLIENWIGLYEEGQYSLPSFCFATLIILVAWPVEVFLKIRSMR